MRRRALILVPALAAVAAAQHPPRLRLPPRADSARTGVQIAAALDGMSVVQREAFLWHEFAAGNVPSFVRDLVPVTTRATIQGRVRSATFWCTPDHIGVGSDADWFRMPMTPELAQQLADRLGCALPSRRMVDAIWSTAPVKLPPSPISPASHPIQALAVFYQHHQRIEQQRQGYPRNLLVAGTKKDVVASALIAGWPGRVCIYGWHQQNGTPIQPLSKVHTSSYVDYSHGIRLVDQRVEIDGAPRSLASVLADPVLHPLLSDEGPFASHRYPAATHESFPLHDSFATQGPALAGWQARFAAPVPVATTPAPPSGDATALRIMDPLGGTDSLRFEAGLARDAAFEADLLCEHRPQLAADGFERIGVFVRDGARGAFDGTLSQQGACYALTWDSHDGRLRCLRASGGALVDLLPTPRHAPGTTWRRFRIEASGTTLRFHLDGELLLETRDTTHASGSFGIGYHEYFATNANMRGARVDTCHADVPGALELALLPGFTTGSIRVQRRRAVPGDAYFTAVTVAPGAFPHGWFFGLDPGHPQLLSQLRSGHPYFFGIVGPAGTADVTAYGLPIGLQVQAVAFTLDPFLRRLEVSQPVEVEVR